MVHTIYCKYQQGSKVAKKHSKELKKKMKKIYTEAYVPLDMYPVDVFFTSDKDKFKAMCDWIKVDTVLEVGGRTIMNAREDGSMMLYIGVFNGQDSSLAHECVHASMFISEAIGHTVTYTDEIVPYMTGYLFDKCKEKMV